MTVKKRNDQHLAIRVALTYGSITAFLFIVTEFLSISILNGSRFFQVAEGATFVTVTSLLIYGIVRYFSINLRKHEERLEKSEKSYQSLIQQSSHGITVIDPNRLIIQDTNSVMAEWLEMDKDQLVGTVVEKWFPDWAKLYQKVKEEETIEWKLNTKQSIEISVLVQAHEMLYHEKPMIMLNVINMAPIKSKEDELNKLAFEHNRLIYSMDSVKQGILVSDTINNEHVVKYANQGFAEMMKLKKETICNRPLLEIFDVIMSDVQKEHIRKAMFKHQSTTVEFKAVNQDSETFWNKLYIEPVITQEEYLINYVFFFVDITPRKNMEKVLNSHNKLFKEIFKSGDSEEILASLTGITEEVFPGAIVSILHSEGENQTFVSPSMELSMGRKWKGFIRDMFSGVFFRGDEEEAFFVEYTENSPILARAREVLLDQGIKTVVSVPIYGKNKEWIGFFQVFFKEKKQLTQYEKKLIMENVHLSRITVLSKQAEELIYHQANYDMLTDLPNRRRMLELMKEELDYCSESNYSSAVYYLDIDRFKTVNDSFGHQGGNLVLKEVAVRLESLNIKDLIVSRLNSDEFVALVCGNKKENNFEKIAKQLKSVFEKPFYIGKHVFNLKASIGISIYPEHGKTAQELIRNADIAMYLAKEKGKNSIQYYDERLGDRTRQSLLMESHLKKAIESGAFKLFYQPQYDLREGNLVGYEALARWSDPEFGPISPTEFIPIAEETGLIVGLGRWVLEEACRQNKAWQDAGYPPVEISVNISLKQFMQTNFVQTVIDTLEDTGLSSEYLTLEITESIAMHRPDITIDAMQKLRALGIKISIDDFGTGYSSLTHLKDLPVQTLKIDRSFINELSNSNSKAFAITHSTIHLAHNLGLEIVAEGIETREQMQVLKDYDCQYGQGYYFSAPIPSEEAKDLLIFAKQKQTEPLESNSE